MKHQHTFTAPLDMQLVQLQLPTHFELLQFEAQVDQFHHRVLLFLWMFWQLQDQLLTLLYCLFQLFNVWGHKWTLQQPTQTTWLKLLCSTYGCFSREQGLLTTGLEKWSSARPRSIVRSELWVFAPENSSGCASENRQIWLKVLLLKQYGSL